MGRGCFGPATAAMIVLATVPGAPGCGSTPPPAGELAPVRCGTGQYFDGARCQHSGRATASLDAGAAALRDFQVDQALEHLNRARAQGPHTRAERIRLYEQLGIAHAYLGHEEKALAAFDALLTLDPGHLLPYTLSPKATFLFERARKSAASRPAPSVDVSWPRKLEVDNAVPIDVEVVADPKEFLARAVIHVRRAGDTGFGQVPLELSASGERTQVWVPAAGGAGPQTLELFVTAFDEAGNEVLRWASPERPREIPLGYSPPRHWYTRWWIWAAAGTVLAASTGATVFLLSQDPPDTIGATADID